MESIFDQEKPRLSDQEIFSKIWTDPRAVFRYLDDHHYDRYTHVLLILTGIFQAWNVSFSYMLMHGGAWERKLPEMIGIVIVSYVVYCCYAALIIWTGRWFQAENTFKPMLRLVAHARIPALAGSFLSFLIQFYNASSTEHVSFAPQPLYYNMLAALTLVTTIWTLALYVIGIMEVQRLPAGKAIANAVVAALILAVPLVLFNLYRR